MNERNVLNKFFYLFCGAVALLTCTCACQTNYRCHAFFKLTSSGLNNQTMDIPVSDSPAVNRPESVSKNDTVFQIYIETAKGSSLTIDSVVIGLKTFQANLIALTDAVFFVGRTRDRQTVVSLRTQPGKRWWHINTTFLRMNLRKELPFRGVSVFGKINGKFFQSSVVMKELEPEFRL